MNLTIAAIIISMIFMSDNSNANTEDLSLSNRIVAVVNKDIILLDELLEAFYPMQNRMQNTKLQANNKREKEKILKEKILQTLIAEKLLEQ